MFRFECVILHMGSLGGDSTTIRSEKGQYNHEIGIKTNIP